ncbi:MAG: helix-turn-helix transcriptional regulator [Isosphaeraceae bacterium]
MMKHKDMVASMLRDSAVRAEYEGLEEEFALLDELLRARRHAGLTQAEVAEKMGAKTPAVARLEDGTGGKRYSPSLATLRKYAAAVGCRLEIRLRPRETPASDPHS